MTDPWLVTPETSCTPAETSTRAGMELKVALWVAGLVNLGAMGIMLPLAATPTGNTVYPLDRVHWLLWFQVMAFLIGLPLAIAAIWQESEPRHRLLGTIALAGCLSPVITGHLTLELLAHLIGFLFN